MKTNHFLGGLAMLVLAFLGLSGSAWADGFIVVHEPAQIPIGHFSFAPLEVSYHHVAAKIDGQICTTTVDEEFYNPNQRQLEGTYLFPVPKMAQIDRFTMEVGGKEVTAELLPAAKAREIYEDIVRRRMDPALLEYADRGVFKVRIFPIEAGSRKRVKIVYTEMLKSDSGLVAYTYPLNTEKFSAAPVHDVSVRVELKSDRPIASIYSPSHQVEIKRDGANGATVGFEAKNVRPDTDFQLFFSLEKSDVSMNLVTYRTGPGDGYFLLLASPSLDAKTKRLPKDVAFVLDTSGSMADGNKLKQAKKALQFCLANLNDDDRFEIVRFSTEAEPLFGSLVKADETARDKAGKFVDSLTPAGGTAIDAALGKALAMRPQRSERPFVLIFLTDGEPTVGETRDDPIVARAEKAGAEGTRIFCFGMGTDVNAHLLDRIAEQSHGASDYVLPEEDIEVKVSNFFAKIREPVLAEVKLTFPDGVRVTKMQPQAMPDLFKGAQLVLSGRYSGDGSGNCTIEGMADGEKKTFTTAVSFPKEAADQPFVARLWASRRVAFLLDEIRLHGENGELKEEAADLAREFGLVTPYTAYLIMEDEKTRGVTSENQAMRSLAADQPARAAAAGFVNAFNDQKSGAGAVAVSKAQNNMKESGQASLALDKSNEEFARSMGLADSSVTTKPAMGIVNAPSSPNSSVRLVQYAQQTRYLAGRAFFQNGNQWVDGNVSKQNSGKNVRVKFGSPEYFALLTAHPEAGSYLSLGKNVKLVLGDAVYDIFDEGTAG